MFKLAWFPPSIAFQKLFRCFICLMVEAAAAFLSEVPLLSAQAWEGTFAFWQPLLCISLLHA